MKTLLFDKEISIRSHYCSINGDIPDKIEKPYINMYIQLDGCNAKCSFCEFMNTNIDFDYQKLNSVLSELKKQININKISITGGEPTLNTTRLYRIILIIKNHFPKTFLVMNTNGLNLEKLDREGVINQFDSISISRHHYNDETNNKIFKTNCLSNDELCEITKRYKDTEIFHFSCNLIKGNIDSKNEVYKYLEFCSSMDVTDVGFVGLMKINQYCEDQYIDLEINDLLSDRFHKMKRMNYKDYCKCYNYLYIPENTENACVKVYARHVLKNCETMNSLVFNGENVKLGFNGIILK